MNVSNLTIQVKRVGWGGRLSVNSRLVYAIADKTTGSIASDDDSLLIGEYNEKGLVKCRNKLTELREADTKQQAKVKADKGKKVKK